MITVRHIKGFVSACFLILLLSNCTNKQEEAIEQTLFETFLDSLPDIELPCNFSTRDFSLSDFDIPELQQFDSLREDGGIPFAQFKRSDSTICILYAFPADILIPVLYTYTVNGEKISSLPLWNNYGWSPESECFDYTSIDTSFKIHSHDTTYIPTHINNDSIQINAQQWTIHCNGIIRQ